METQTHAVLWAALRERLRLRLGEETFDRWIAPLKVISESGSLIRLGVANLFVQDWVRKRYLPLIVDTLRDPAFLASRPELADGLEALELAETHVELAIDPVLFKERRAESEKLLGGARQKGTDAEAAGSASVPAGPGGHQPPRDARLESEQTLETFVVGETNRHAHSAALQVLERPGGLYNPLFLFGPSGVGKTHLLRGLYKAFRSRRRGHHHVRISYLTGEQFFQHYVSSIQDRSMRSFQERYRSLDVLILDDVHLLVNKKKTQLEFLHTFSSLADAGRQIILASDVPPKGLKDLEVGLVGRFTSGLVAGIKRPDLLTRLEIARSQATAFSPRFAAVLSQLGALRLVAESVRGNAREILGAIKLLHHYATMQGGSIDFKKAEEVLSGFVLEHSRRIDLRKVHEVVSAYYSLPCEALLSPSRERHVAFARQVAMYLGRSYTRLSLAEVGKYFGKRNHTTVKCAQTKIAKLLKADGSSLAAEIDNIREILEE